MDFQYHLRTATELANATDPLPADIRKALTAFSAIDDMPEPAPLDLDADLAAAKPNQLGEVLDSHADARMRHQHLATVRQEARSALGARLAAAVTANASQLIEAWRTDFDNAATAFAEAFAELPTEYGPEALVAAGSTVLARFERARAAADVLDVIRGRRLQLIQFGAVVLHDDVSVEEVTRFATARNTGSARRAANNLFDRNTDPLGIWGVLLATDGVTGLHLPTPAEQAAYLAKLPEVENKYVRTEDGVGHVLVEA